MILYLLVNNFIIIFNTNLSSINKTNKFSFEFLWLQMHGHKSCPQKLWCSNYYHIKNSYEDDFIQLTQLFWITCTYTNYQDIKETQKKKKIGTKSNYFLSIIQWPFFLCFELWRIWFAVSVCLVLSQQISNHANIGLRIFLGDGVWQF